MMIADWQEQLAGLTDEQIIVGLDHLPKSWPPTVDEFRVLCTGGDVSKGLSHNTAAYIPFIPERERKGIEKKADKEKAHSALGKAKAMLSGQVSAREQRRQLDDANRILFGGDQDG